MAKNSAKLSAKQKVKVLSLIAGGWTSVRIVEYLKEEYDIVVSRPNIHTNYIKNPKYRGRIRRIRNIIEKNLAAHPLSSKTNRLNLLLEAANEAMTWRLDKIVYDKNGNELSRIEKRNMGIIPKIVEEARKEVEGDVHTTEHGSLIVNFINLIEEINVNKGLGQLDRLKGSVDTDEILNRFVAK